MSGWIGELDRLPVPAQRDAIEVSFSGMSFALIVPIRPGPAEANRNIARALLVAKRRERVRGYEFFPRKADCRAPRSQVGRAPRRSRGGPDCFDVMAGMTTRGRRFLFP